MTEERESLIAALPRVDAALWRELAREATRAATGRWEAPAPTRQTLAILSQLCHADRGVMTYRRAAELDEVRVALGDATDEATDVEREGPLWIYLRLPLAEGVGAVALGWRDRASADRYRAASQAALTEVTDAVVAVVTAQSLAERIATVDRGRAPALIEEATATLSHELRTPLAAIKGYTTMLLRYDRRLRREERLEYLHAIDAACDKQETLIARLVRLTRREAEWGEREAVDVVTLAREALRIAERRASHEAPARFSFTFAARAAPLLVWANAGQVREVLDQLLENAIRFSPAGGLVEIAIAPAMSLVEIMVRDHGPGIQTDDIARIFLPFHQAEMGLTRSNSGLGLGLTFCQRVVQAHGGELVARNASDGGSQFSFTLPLISEPPPR